MTKTREATAVGIRENYNRHKTEADEQISAQLLGRGALVLGAILLLLLIWFIVVVVFG